jgi:hypothetical protein
MATGKLTNFNLRNPQKVNPLIPILVIWGLVLTLGFAFIWFEYGLNESMKSFYLIPWVFLAAMVVLSPTVYLVYKKKFDPFHPLVFAAWTYVFPALVFGGVIVSMGWVNPYFLTFIEDPEYNLPLTLVYIALGFLGLIVGYAIPIGKYFAEKIEPRLPKWEWDPSEVWLPGILLMLAGIGINILGFIQGIMGFQRVTDINIFDGVIYFLLILLSEGNILLWLAIFSAKKKTGIYWIVLVLLILFLPLRMALLGSRSSLLISMFPIAMAFIYSGRRLRWQSSLVFGSLVAVAVCLGVIYGTTFRNLKGSEARMNAGDYLGQVTATLDYISTADPGVLVQTNAQSLADRVENLSSLGVVVANYEKLAPYEASFGLENNIINDTYTSFIPRFVWADKPTTSDARAYSDLYFNFGENSFAITPFGDLLRNFGPVGVPLGMLILGIYLRLIYAALIETPNPSLWKKVAYFPLMTLVSYEAFYATIFPSIIRTVVVLAISLFIANLFVMRKKKMAPERFRQA